MLGISRVTRNQEDIEETREYSYLSCSRFTNLKMKRHPVRLSGHVFHYEELWDTHFEFWFALACCRMTSIKFEILGESYEWHRVTQRTWNFHEDLSAYSRQSDDPMAPAPLGPPTLFMCDDADIWW